MGACLQSTPLTAQAAQHARDCIVMGAARWRSTCKRQRCTCGAACCRQCQRWWRSTLTSRLCSELQHLTAQSLPTMPTASGCSCSGSFPAHACYLIIVSVLMLLRFVVASSRKGHVYDVKVWKSLDAALTNSSVRPQHRRAHTLPTSEELAELQSCLNFPVRTAAAVWFEVRPLRLHTLLAGPQNALMHVL